MLVYELKKIKNDLKCMSNYRDHSKVEKKPKFKWIYGTTEFPSSTTINDS